MDYELQMPVKANVEGLFGKSDFFYKCNVDKARGLTWDNVYCSGVEKKNLNPEWEAAIAIFDHKSKEKHVTMCKFETTVNGFQNAAKAGGVIHIKQKGKDVGTISIVCAEASGVQLAQLPLLSAPIPSVPQAGHTEVVAPMSAMSVTVPGMACTNFVDYVSGGYKLNVVVAVDFTGSNGDPHQPRMLH